MKELLFVEVDRTTQNIIKNFEPFIVRKTTDSQTQKIIEKGKTVQKLEQNKGVPRWLVLLTMMSMYLVVIVLVIWLFMLVSKDNEQSFSNFMEKYLALEIIMLVGLVLAIGLNITLQILKRKKGQSKGVILAKEKLEEVLTMAKKYLDIPQETKSYDFLLEYSVLKDGKKLKKSGLVYDNVTLFVFEKDDQIFFADLYSVLAIPKKAFTSITKEEKIIRFSQWNKEEKIKSSKYAKYGLKFNRYGYLINYCYNLNFNFDGEDYEIKVMPYEIEEIANIIGLESEEKTA